MELRRRVHVDLNKGEARNALARAVFFHRLGEMRDRSFENQKHRASGLNLLAAAIVLWNTVYLERAVESLRSHGYSVDEDLLQHLSPLGWDHIALTGDYYLESASIGAEGAIWRAATPHLGLAPYFFRSVSRPLEGCEWLLLANRIRHHGSGLLRAKVVQGGEESVHAEEVGGNGGRIHMLRAGNHCTDAPPGQSAARRVAVYSRCSHHQPGRFRGRPAPARRTRARFRSGSG